MRCYKDADKTKKLSDGKIIAGWGIVVQRMMPSQYGAWSLSVLAFDCILSSDGRTSDMP